MDICGNCGKKADGGYCKDCKKKTLLTNSGFERGFDIPQVPMSFNSRDPLYGGFIFKPNHAMHIIKFDDDTTFGNLNLIFYNVLMDIEQLNKRIEECFRSYAIGMYYDFSAKITDHQRMVEEVIYWMRRIIDRLISLHWFLYESRKNKSYPNVIKIDCIGRLLNLVDDDDFKKEYAESDLDFLRFLNEASNAYKHSFIHGESPSSRIGKEEPLVITLGLVNNDASKEQKYSHKSLAEATLMFISFYKGAREKLEECKV